MQRLLSVRITGAGVKVLYVLGFLLLGVVLTRAVPVVGSMLTDVIQLGAIWYGARVFRGAGEPIEPPRAWWRMTAWRSASAWIALSAVAVFVWLQVSAMLEWAGTYQGGLAQSSLPEQISLTLFWAAVAFLYLNSWMRLRGIRKPPPLRREGSASLAKPQSRLQ